MIRLACLRACFARRRPLSFEASHAQHGYMALRTLLEWGCGIFSFAHATIGPDHPSLQLRSTRTRCSETTHGRDEPNNEFCVVRTTGLRQYADRVELISVVSFDSRLERQVPHTSKDACVRLNDIAFHLKRYPHV